MSQVRTTEATILFGVTCKARGICAGRGWDRSFFQQYPSPKGLLRPRSFRLDPSFLHRRGFLEKAVCRKPSSHIPEAKKTIVLQHEEEDQRTSLEDMSKSSNIVRRPTPLSLCSFLSFRFTPFLHSSSLIFFPRQGASSPLTGSQEPKKSLSPSPCTVRTARTTLDATPICIDQRIGK